MSNIEQLKNLSEEINSITVNLKNLNEQELRIKVDNKTDKPLQLIIIEGMKAGYYSQLDFCYKRLVKSYDEIKKLRLEADYAN